MKELIESSFQSFAEIGSTTSRLAKEETIRKEKDNEVFKNMLMYAYNPYKMFYVKKFKIPTAQSDKSMNSNYVAFFNLLDRLAERSLSGHAALGEIDEVFSHMSEVEQKWYARILQKDLKIGITSGT